MLQFGARQLLFYLLFLTIYWSLFLAACTPTEPELISVTEVIQLGEEQIIITRLAEPTATPTATPVPPQVIDQPAALDLAYSGSLPQLDPQQATSTSYDLIENLFVGLTRFNHETQQIEPQLAEDWTLSSDGLTWTFDLRDDIYWFRPAAPPADVNDLPELEPVRPVVSWDVVRAIERICRSETGTPDAFIFFIIEGCEAVYRNPDPTEEDIAAIAAEAIDATTLEIRLTHPASYFLTMTSLPQIRPVPGELIEEHGEEWRLINEELANGWQTPDNIMVSGPFIPSAADFSDDQLILYQNPYWPINRKGNIDLVHIAFQQDDMEIFEAYQANALDLSPLPISEREAFLERTPAKALLITNQTVFYIGFNFDSAVFRDPLLRRAFAASIDRSELIEEMFEGRGLELKHFSPPGAIGAPPVNEVGVGYSPDFARHQMDSSGIRSCRLIPPVTFLISTADLSLLQAELVRSMWINEMECTEDLINIVQEDFGSLLVGTTPSAPNRPDMWELAWPGIYPDAHNLLYDLFHCTEGENRQNRECSEVDRLLRQASLTPRIEERRDLYRQAENLFFGETGIMPLIPLYVRGNYLLIQNWLAMTPALSGGQQFDTFVIDKELKRLEQSRDQE